MRLNKRLRELAKQAGGKPIHPSFFRGHFMPPPPDYIDPSTVDLEKFAKLIAQECAKICVNVSNTTRIDHTPHEGDVCSYNIKQHFGVE